MKKNNIIMLQITVPEQRKKKELNHEILCRFRNFVFDFQKSWKKAKPPAEMYVYPSLYGECLFRVLLQVAKNQFISDNWL